jgi:hypothetical protein
MRRLLLSLLLVVVLAASASGCGSTSKAVGGLVAHSIANHVVKSAAGRRRVNKIFCLYQAERAISDLRRHHATAAAINAYAAYHSCKGGFGSK